MKLRFGYGLLLVVGMISSCTSSPSFEACERFTWQDLGEQVFLQGDSVVFDEMPLQPTRVAVVDSFLIIKNQNAERFFYVYNVDNCRKTGERIPFGIGPDEMIDPVWMLMPDGDLGVLDRNQRRMDIYPGHELLVSDSVKPVRHFSFNELLLNAMVLPAGDLCLLLLSRKSTVLPCLILMESVPFILANIRKLIKTGQHMKNTWSLRQLWL